jgi:hypothetical protein
MSLPVTAPVLGALALLAAPAPAQDEVRWGPWYVLRPFDHPGGGADVATQRSPEGELGLLVAGGIGPDLTRIHDGRSGAIAWTRLERADEIENQQRIDLGLDVPAKAAHHVVAYLYRSIVAPSEVDVRVRCGSDDGLRLWLNGSLLIDAAVLRGLNPAQHDLALHLQPGRNHLLAKVPNEGGAWGFQLLHDEALHDEERAHLQPSIQRAIERGTEYLLRSQEIDGSWRFDGERFRNGCTALCTYALLKSGIDEEHPAVRRALAFLRCQPPQETYSAACQLMAFGALRKQDVAEEMQALADFLLESRQGLWAYPAGDPDASNSQYGALGLRAAALAGIKVPARAWTEMADEILSWQNGDGGFGYHRGEPSRGSLTCGGLTVLAACLEQVGDRESVLPAAFRKEIERAIERGIAWLVARLTYSHNPAGDDRWTLYFLYGLERVGGLTRRERFGDHDWYWEGAVDLLPRQGAQGEWVSPYADGLEDTCFALLFLRRATATYTGMDTPQRKASKGWGTDQARGDAALRAQGDGKIALWIAAFGTSVRERLSWPKEAGNSGLQVLKVEYLVDESVRATVEAGQAADPRFPAQIAFDANGTFALQARITLARPPKPDADLRLGLAARDGEEVILSNELIVEVAAASDPLLLRYASDPQRNLLGTVQATASASSEHDGWPAARVLDGRAAFGWLAKADDARRALRVDLAKPVRADRLLLTHAIPDRKDPWLYARARRVEVVLNRSQKNALMLEVDPDPRRKVEIPLGKAHMVRTLEVRIVELQTGANGEPLVGFGEVELVLD